MRGWVSCSAYGERVDLLTDLTAHAFSLDTSHVWLDGTGTAATQEVTPDFWRNLVAGAGPRGTWLLGGGLRTEDTSSWDLHPEGECVFLLVTGAMAIVVDEGVAGERTIDASRGVPPRYRVVTVVASAGVDGGTAHPRPVQSCCVPARLTTAVAGTGSGWSRSLQTKHTDFGFVCRRSCQPEEETGHDQLDNSQRVLKPVRTPMLHP